MHVKTARSLIRTVASRWKKQYSRDMFRENRGDECNIRADEIFRMLDALDKETATEEDVTRIIGNSSWTGVGPCDECGGHPNALVVVGEPPDWESATARLCVGCVRKALRLLEEVEK